MKKLHFLAAFVIATFATTQVSAQVMHTVGNVQLEALPTTSSNPNVITSDALGNLAYRSAASFSGTDWSLLGNSITGSEILGTTNAFPLNFYTNNLQRMSLGTDGKLGLGVFPTSNAAFHILTGSNPGQLPSNFIFERNDGTNQAGVFSLGISGSVWPTFASTIGAGSACFKLDDPFGNSQNSDMVFSTNATAPQFIIKHSGYVGIGTTSPTANFHSIGTARLESLPTSTTNTDIITTDASGNLSTQSASTLFSATTWNLNGNTTTSTDFLGTLTNEPLNFKTQNTDRAVITSTGDMGVGTMTPTAKLEVVTSALTTPALNALGKSVGIYAEATAQESNLIKRSNIYSDLDGIAIFGDAKYTTNTTNGSMYGVVGSATTTSINNVGVFGEAKNANGYNQGVIGYVNSPTGTFNAGVSGQVELNTTAAWNRAVWGIAPVAPNHFAGYFEGNVDVQTGNVRIGNVTTPVGYKLYVEQGILTEKVMVALASSSSWADYVFAKDYKLMPLSEVETYVNANKHLPNIPSAEELQKEGIDLGKMQAKQMEKIEELTLYLIEMKKEIEILKSENTILKAKN